MNCGLIELTGIDLDGREYPFWIMPHHIVTVTLRCADEDQSYLTDTNRSHHRIKESPEQVAHRVLDAKFETRIAD